MWNNLSIFMNDCMTKCGICENTIYAKGMCQKHYYRLRKYGDPTKISRAENGSKLHVKNNFIYIHNPEHPNARKDGKVAEHYIVMSQHLGRAIENNEYIIHINGNNSDNRIENLKLMVKHEFCIVANCNKKTHSLDYCNKHYRKFLKYGDPTCGKIYKDPRPQGSGALTRGGYIRIQDPNKKGKTIFEHRYVMEQYLGRKLLPYENIHHKNGNRQDNRLENLELWIKNQPPGQRVEDLYSWAREIISMYSTYINSKNKKGSYECI